LGDGDAAGEAAVLVGVEAAAEAAAIERTRKLLSQLRTFAFSFKVWVSLEAS
jgi:hypothetical protein